MPPRLLSDVDGKIRHVLLCLTEGYDAERVGSIIKAFDDDVEVSVVHETGKQGKVPNYLLTKAKSLLHIGMSGGLERVVSELPNRKKVNFIAVQSKPWMWAQDLIHVSEGKVVSPSRSVNEQAGSERGRFAQQTSLELITQQFWSEHGFSVEAKETGLNNSDGGDLIVLGDTVFVGGGLIDNYLHFKMGVKNVFTAGGKTFERARNSVMSGLKAYEGGRKFRFVSLHNSPFPGHLDMVFTPLSEDCFVLADIKGAISMLNLPREVKLAPPYHILVDLLEDLAERLASQHKSVKIVRIPCIPRLVLGTDDKSPLTHFMSFNNVLQERFKGKNGVNNHRVYVPAYNVLPSPLALRYIDVDALLRLQNDALNVYRGLGHDIRPVTFPLISGYDGALRCSVKVLERGS